MINWVKKILNKLNNVFKSSSKPKSTSSNAKNAQQVTQLLQGCLLFFIFHIFGV
jgi:hypothetical protein